MSFFGVKNYPICQEKKYIARPIAISDLSRCWETRSDHRIKVQCTIAPKETKKGSGNEDLRELVFWTKIVLFVENLLN